MQLESLRALNLSKKATLTGDGFLKDAFCLDSCQRRLWICAEEDLHELAIPGEMKIYAGAGAYEYLLRVACGLESQILGETDIFGQFKTAYKSFVAAADPARVSELNPWIQRVFEDTKEIRSRHLHHQGGDSYGTLVRKMLRDAGVRGPVLMLGAGQLAQTVGPFLLEDELFIENRSSEKLRGLVEELGEFPNFGITALDREQAPAHDQAWSRAKALVVCIPFESGSDRERVARWTRDGADRPVIHLGDLSGGGSGIWKSLPSFRSLDDLFELQRAQGEIRTVQTQRAFKACEERAKLRALGNSVSIPHGWEDLAVFA